MKLINPRLLAARVRLNSWSSFFVVWLLLQLSSCSSGDYKLPILGNSELDGKDTVYHQIPDFTFISQDSQLITNASFAGKAYVADFFFISCPTICPKVKKQMLRIYEAFETEDRLMLLSHTIDPKRDTVGRLKHYADNLGVRADKWLFVTGDKDAIYDLVPQYMSVAEEDPDAPGGFNHSGWLLLVDENRHLRAFCNGTDPKEVDQFMTDIRMLLKEMDRGKAKN